MSAPNGPAIHGPNLLPHEPHGRGRDHLAKHHSVGAGAREGLPVCFHLFRRDRLAARTRSCRVEALCGLVLATGRRWFHRLHLIQILGAYVEALGIPETRILVAGRTLTEDRHSPAVRFPGWASDPSASSSTATRRGRNRRSRGPLIWHAAPICCSRVSTSLTSPTTMAKTPTSPRCSRAIRRRFPQATASIT